MMFDTIRPSLSCANNRYTLFIEKDCMYIGNSDVYSNYGHWPYFEYVLFNSALFLGLLYCKKMVNVQRE